MTCDQRYCDNLATITVRLVLKDENETFLQKTGVKKHFCSIHNKPEWRDVLSHDQWNDIVVNFRKHGFRPPNVHKSELLIEKIN